MSTKLIPLEKLLHEGIFLKMASKIAWYGQLGEWRKRVLVLVRTEKHRNMAKLLQKSSVPKILGCQQTSVKTLCVIRAGWTVANTQLGPLIPWFLWCLNSCCFSPGWCRQSLAWFCALQPGASDSDCVPCCGELPEPDTFHEGAIGSPLVTIKLLCLQFSLGVFFGLRWKTHLSCLNKLKAKELYSKQKTPTVNDKASPWNRAYAMQVLWRIRECQNFPFLFIVAKTESMV